MTDDQNSQKMLVDCIHIVDIEFSRWPVRFIRRLMCLQLFAYEITQSYEKNYHLSYLFPSGWFIKQRIKLNRLGSWREKAKKYFDSWTCAEPWTPPLNLSFVFVFFTGQYPISCPSHRVWCHVIFGRACRYVVTRDAREAASGFCWERNPRKRRRGSDDWEGRRARSYGLHIICLDAH